MGSVGRPAIMLLLLLLPVALAGLPPHHQQLVERFGAENVNFDKNVRTAFCDSCMEITVESNGGAQEHQPNRLGRFTRDGSLWENMVPFWTADNAQHITPDPMSNPVIYYLKWVVSETVGGFNAGLMNEDYTDGSSAPTRSLTSGSMSTIGSGSSTPLFALCAPSSGTLRPKFRPSSSK